MTKRWRLRHPRQARLFASSLASKSSRMRNTIARAAAPSLACLFPFFVQCRFSRLLPAPVLAHYPSCGRGRAVRLHVKRKRNIRSFRGSPRFVFAAPRVQAFHNSVPRDFTVKRSLIIQ
jgi:hypothetical protein